MHVASDDPLAPPDDGVAAGVGIGIGTDARRHGRADAARRWRRRAASCGGRRAVGRGSRRHRRTSLGSRAIRAGDRGATPRRDPRCDAGSADRSQLAKRLGFRAIDIQPLIGANGQAIGALGLMFRQNRTTKKQRTHMVDLTTSLLVSAVMQARASPRGGAAATRGRAARTREGAADGATESRAAHAAAIDCGLHRASAARRTRAADASAGVSARSHARWRTDPRSRRGRPDHLLAARDRTPQLRSRLRCR